MSDIETRIQQIAQVLGQLEDNQVPRNIRNASRDALNAFQDPLDFTKTVFT